MRGNKQRINKEKNRSKVFEHIGAEYCSNLSYAKVNYCIYDLC